MTTRLKLQNAVRHLTISLVPIEAVSRKFAIPRKDWMGELKSFWYAFNSAFTHEYCNESAGSHVHVAPLGPDFTLEDLRKIAFAVIIYEKHVLEFLPEARKNHSYCRPNTSVSPELRQIFSNGRSKASYATLNKVIKKLNTPSQVRELMQGTGDDNRRVLWNFANVTPGLTGTIEFRGGPALHNVSDTVAWVLFTLGFIMLALYEVCSYFQWTHTSLACNERFVNEYAQDELSQDNFSYVSPGTPLFQHRADELWSRIRRRAKRTITKKLSLPHSYRDMMDDVNIGYSSEASSTAGSVASSGYTSRASSSAASLVDSDFDSD